MYYLKRGNNNVIIAFEVKFELDLFLNQSASYLISNYQSI